MVRLTRIYTRTGDRGKTRLGDGTTVPKSHPRIVAYGTVDELNAVLGMARAPRLLARRDQQLLGAIQNDLFDVGADLSVPVKRGEKRGERLRVTAERVAELEAAIDDRNATLPELRSFVLPFGNAGARWLHVARTVCRRAEIEVVRLLEAEPRRVNPVVLTYLNRLSDLLFVMSRAAARRAGGRETLWQPGAHQETRSTTRRSGSGSPARGRRT